MAHRTPRSLLILAALGLILPGTALAKKNKKKNKEAAATTAVEATPDIPADANSKKFAKGLMAANIRNFSPTDAAMSATFLFDTLQFLPDNTWVGKGYVEIIDERMECTESGSWTMEPAQSPTTATISWKVEKTDCAGRDPGVSVRAVVTLTDDGDIDVLYR